MERKAEDYVNDYKLVGKDPKKIEELPYLGDHEKSFFKNSFLRAYKEKDPINLHKKIIEVYERINQIISWYIGRTGAKPSQSEEDEERITNGHRVLEEMLNK